MTGTSAGRIDVHAHFVPDFYREAAVAAGHSRPDGIPAFPEWSAQAAIESMDAVGVATALLSISSPGVHFGDDSAARALARRVNDAGAELVAGYGGRFGLFASLPLPGVDGALEEIAHAFDVLGADGVIVLSNARGIYPADPRFEPVLAELDRRGAVVFLHPTSPACGCGTPVDMAYPRPMLEFMFETTRAVADLIFRGIPQRYPGIRFVIPHAGAALPVLADRLQAFGAVMVSGAAAGGTDVLGQLQRFYYDVAGFPLPRLLPALETFADPAHILYGSDWPFTPLPLVRRLAQELDTYLEGDDEAAARIRRGNALALLPRLGR